jgi:glutamate-ammonia-ligase adenylyltransferase
MRGRIEREKAAANDFDVKLARGGIIDCEFAAQFLVLSGLRRIAGETTVETLERAGREASMPVAAGERLVESALMQSAILQTLRIAGEPAFDPDEAPDALQRILVASVQAALRSKRHEIAAQEIACFDALRNALAETQAATRPALETVLGTTLG